MKQQTRRMFVGSTIAAIPAVVLTGAPWGFTAPQRRDPLVRPGDRTKAPIPGTAMLDALVRESAAHANRMHHQRMSGHKVQSSDFRTMAAHWRLLDAAIDNSGLRADMVKALSEEIIPDLSTADKVSARLAALGLVDTGAEIMSRYEEFERLPNHAAVMAKYQKALANGTALQNHARACDAAADRFVDGVGGVHMRLAQDYYFEPEWAPPMEASGDGDRAWCKFLHMHALLASVTGLFFALLGLSMPPFEIVALIYETAAVGFEITAFAIGC